MTAAGPTARHRPGSVTLVVVLTWLSAIASILGGILLIVLSRTASTPLGPNMSAGLLVFGILALVLGLVTAAVASRLGKGSNIARIIVSLIQVLHIGGAVANFATGGREAAVQGVVSLVLAVVILVLLWNSKANAFFGRHANVTR